MVTISSLAAWASAENAEVFLGDLVIDTDESGRVLVALDVASSTSPADGIADHLFILQREERLPELAHSLASARLVFTGDELRIDSTDGTYAVTLSVRDDVPDRPDLVLDRRSASSTRGEAANAGARQRVRGVGLTHVWGGIEGSSYDAIAQERARAAVSRAIVAERSKIVCGPDGGGSNNNVDCTSGGCGASSCSVTGCYQFPTACSVECTSGYFACCQCPTTSGASCKCEKNDLCGSNC